VKTDSVLNISYDHAKKKIDSSFSLYPYAEIRGGADKSLARTTSQGRRTESWKTAGFRLNQ
jgi:hypothetical protein